ncbi:MAG TPA: hypothetical protein VFI69_05715 [Candidatus Limnocylindrales bacterium]|nr:hypothetical protein [Candidatus Limnocylindrales bacterium]
MNRSPRIAIAVMVTLLAVVVRPAAPAAAAVVSATLTSSVGNGLDGFGRSVATSGDIVVAGAPHHDAGDDVNSDEGAAFVYQRGPAGWSSGTELAMLTASDAEPGDQLGWAVAISGDVIAVSAIRANGGAGAVYVFVKPAGGWTSMTETAYLRGSTGDFLDLGWSLAMSGDMVVAGAPSYDAGAKDDAGAILIFEKPAAGWGPRSAGDVTETRFITLPTPQTHGQLGLAVAASGPTVVVGSPGEGPFTGAAYVFQADLTIGWSTITLLARLSASDGDSNDAFGTAVSVKGRLVAVGAPCDDDLDGTPCAGASGQHSFGSVYVFREPFTGWVSTTELGRLHAASPHAFDNLGRSVAITDDGIFAGAAGSPTGSSFSGSVYRFVQPSAGWADATEADLETQPNDRFGQALAGTGHTLAIGDASGNHGGQVTVEVTEPEPTDETPPTTSIELTPDAPDGSNGWYLGPVSVSVSASDADGSVAQTRCELDPASPPTAFEDLPDADCAIGSVDTDGEHVLYAASVDVAGNAESTLVGSTFGIDQTGPTFRPTLNASSVVLGQAGVSAAAGALDATSGVASASCDQVDTTTAGVRTLQCGATDEAGNLASASIDYLVEYRMLGFLQPAPGSKVVAGQAVPLKIALADAAGLRIPDAEAAALAAACRVTFTATGAQSQTAQCVGYDPTKDQFVITWKLAKKPLGSATIRVSVSYPGTSSATVMTRQVTIVAK